VKRRGRTRTSVATKAGGLTEEDAGKDIMSFSLSCLRSDLLSLWNLIATFHLPEAVESQVLSKSETSGSV
jgi:hypothetical protein